MIQETHYDILSVREDASYEEIRTSYRSAILNHHPDKLQKISETSDADNEVGDRFLKAQKAWEVLGNARSRAVYDSELRASREDLLAAEDVSLEDMMIEDNGEVLELVYQCRCADYFSVDSLELGKMGLNSKPSYLLQLIHLQNTDIDRLRWEEVCATWEFRKTITFGETRGWFWGQSFSSSTLFIISLR
ncbi:hypothetical protein LWI28_001308 [Acer negundo]|uniref:J domain-containing protein n=1 Tax=Acer negundo TaxID=4023 RepID=A0AAD5JT01_ACENE|nr:hypothetical protein LWI28_001308 [Acer negundo]